MNANFAQSLVMKSGKNSFVDQDRVSVFNSLVETSDLGDRKSITRVSNNNPVFKS